MKQRAFLIFLVMTVNVLFLSAGNLCAGEPFGERWDMIDDSGITNAVSYSWFTNKVTADSSTIYFPPDTEAVFWWAHLVNNFKTPWVVNAKFTAQWFSPDGKLYRETQAKKARTSNFFFKAKLPVAGADAERLLGEWRVDIYRKEELIDQKRFFIATEAMKKDLFAKMVPPAEKKLPDEKVENKPSSVPPAEAKPVIGPEDTWFNERYQKAKTLFKNGDLAGAEAVFKEVLEKQPYRTEAHLALASVQFRQKHYEDALRELDFVIQNPAFRKQAMELKSEIEKLKKESAKA